jgi:glucose-1-phosphate cytidylyltransferase
MLEVGDRPILWHIMKYYAEFGVNEFIICLGHRGDYIRDYFLNYHTRNVSISLELGEKSEPVFHDTNHNEAWTVTLVDTGKNAFTAERLRQVENYVGDRTFFLTYGDGLSTININAELEFHRAHAGLATLAAVHPRSRFGLVETGLNGMVTEFSEKPVTADWINGGFFIMEPQIFKRLMRDEPLEQGPLSSLSDEGLLFAYEHEGFWQPIDTQRELAEVNRLWAEDMAPWKNWE